MEYQENYNIEQEEPEKRPDMLTIICILSFINAGFQIIVNFISFALYNTYQKIYHEIMKGEGLFEDLAEQMGDSWDVFVQSAEISASISRGYYFLEFLLFTTSFIGVLMMWKLQKRGFHVYAIAQILLLIVTTVFAQISMLPILWTVLFIAMYFMHYKKVMR